MSEVVSAKTGEMHIRAQIARFPNPTWSAHDTASAITHHMFLTDLIYLWSIMRLFYNMSENGESIFSS